MILERVKLAGVLVAAGFVFALTGCNQGGSGSSTPQAAGAPPTATQAPPTTTPPPPSPPTAASGTATLSWLAPTTNTDGSALTDLAGYHIHYGTSTTALDQTVQVGLGIQTYVIENLAAGTWYFAISAVASTGVESALSDVVTKPIG